MRGDRAAVAWRSWPQRAAGDDVLPVAPARQLGEAVHRRGRRGSGEARREEAARVWCCKVEVRETDSNMAGRQGHREDNEFQ